LKLNKINILKSYISDVLLESVPSPYSGNLDLYLSKGRYQLCSPQAIYSFADKYDNFSDSFARLDLSEVHDVLLLGFGLGSIPYMLEKVFHKTSRYTGVDIDPAVISLASKYVLPELSSSIQLIEADAEIFVQIESARYDLVCIDLFIDTAIPSPFLEAEFLQHTMSQLQEGGGMVMFNHLYLTSADKLQAQHYFESVFSKEVMAPEMMELRTNAMLVGYRHTSP